MTAVPRLVRTTSDELLLLASNNLTINDVICCPVTIQRNSHHLHFHVPRLRVPETHPFSAVPPCGTVCWLILPDKLEHGQTFIRGARFLGRILRVAEYQETRVIMLIQHIQSPAILSLAVPYEYFEGDTSSWWGQVIWSIVSRVRLLRGPDHEDYLPGKSCYSFQAVRSHRSVGVSLDPITSEWEICDAVQTGYSPV